MRLQLILAAGLAGLVAGAGPVAAQSDDDDDDDDGHSSDVGLRVYADDDHVTVWSPSASAVATLPHAIVVDAHATVDAVTAASIDVTSSASPYPFTEQRVEGGAGIAVEIARDRRVAATVVVSGERDYTAVRLGARWRAEIARRNATIELGYTAGLDRVGRAGDPTFARERDEHRALASFTQILDRRSYLDVVVEGIRTTGYQANPYRFVPITMAGTVAYALPEAVPDRRHAVAALIRIRRALAEGWFGHGDYRLSRDTWGVTSHTSSIRVIRALHDDEVLVGIEGRGYLQDRANFHQASYAGDGGAPVWRTRDHVLGRMRSLTAGATVQLRLPWRSADATAAAAWMRFAWLDDLRQAQRTAAVATLTLHVPL